MSALITSIARVKETASPDGFLLFCKENDIDPENYAEPEEGVMVDSFDIFRYQTYSQFDDLKRDAAEFSGMRTF